MAKNLSEKQIVLKAANLIDKNGLAKYIRRDGKGRYCVHGAIAKIITPKKYSPVSDKEHEICRNFFNFQQKNAAANSIWRKTFSKNSEYMNGIAYWNNDEKTRKSTVVDALRRYAASLK